MSTRVRVRKDARLHEKTVQQAERHARSHRRGRAPSKTVGGAVTTVKPDPMVWAKALELAGGDVRRLRIESPGVVVVLNNAPERGRR